MGKRTVITAGAAALAFLIGAVEPGAADVEAANVEAEATAAMVDAEGNSVGTVALKQGPHGTLLHARLTGLPPGTRALHLHEFGTCEPPDFQSAGGHYNPNDRTHGFFNEDGYHTGDLPNIHVPESGILEVEVFSERIELNDDLFDDDGTSLMIHTEDDDYRTDPSGDAGGRIACGVIERN